MHLHLDCQFGMAGDMLLAALVDAGADPDVIVQTLRSIPLEGFDLTFRRTSRNGVAAMLADVADHSRADGKKPHPHEHRHHHDHEHEHDHKHEHDHGTEHKHPHDHPHDRDHDCDHDHSHDHNHEPGHEHDHGHDHKHDHPHGPKHIHDHDHANNSEQGKDASGPHRHLGDLLALLDADVIGPRVKNRAERVFGILAAAEATVHGMPVDQVHFHEISGIDTAVDVIGSCLALELLEVDSISATPPSVGSGMVMCAHGIFPVPAPATLEILKSHSIPWRADGEGERATPTGIALLAGLVDSWTGSPELTVGRIGYGAGHREFPDVPNLLRAIIGKAGAPDASGLGSRTRILAVEPEEDAGGAMMRAPDDALLPPAKMARLLPTETPTEGDRVVEFRFAVDDMTPEAVAHLCDRCLAGGALEAYASPVVMKKGRAGHEITVLARPETAHLTADAIWRESSTFGMRISERSRLTLPRDFRTVQVQGHAVRIKLGWRDGVIVRRQPEYEDCRAAALASGVSLMEIFVQAQSVAQDLQ